MLNEEFERDFETVGEDLIQQNLEVPLVIELPATPTSNNNSISNISGTESSGSRRSKRLFKSSTPVTLPTPTDQLISPNICLSNPTQVNKKVPLKHFDFKWKKCTSEKFSVDIPIIQSYPTNSYVKSPLEYFLIFFSNDVFELIVEQSNLYCFQKFDKMLGTNIKEIKDLVGISLIMGIVKMPAYTDYWAPSTNYGQVSNVMSLRRYQQLMRCLHFCDNNCPDDIDRFFKVRKLLDIIRNNGLSVPQGKRFSVDEMMIPYKGKKAGSRKQYMKNKPKKWGYKMFVRAGIDGMVYDFLVYSGDCTFRGITFSPREMSYFRLGPRVVIALSISIPDKPMSVIYFDNFFTTPELISYLRSEFGILSLGTIRKQHLRGCPLNEDKKLMKQPRGTYEYLCDKSKKVIILKWLDNKVVSLASSYTQESKSNTNIIQRYSKDAKKRVPVPYPNIVKEYNTHMGGVDLADMLVALYRTGLKSHKWYMSFFSQMLDISVNNAWLLYRRDCELHKEKDKRLKEFRHEIAVALTSKDKPRLGRRPALENSNFPVKKIRHEIAPRPYTEIRYDKTDHCPTFTKKGRCRHCSAGQTSIICLKCNVRLCLIEGRNCFQQFHYK